MSADASMLRVASSPDIARDDARKPGRRAVARSTSRGSPKHVRSLERTVPGDRRRDAVHDEEATAQDLERSGSYRILRRVVPPRFLPGASGRLILIVHLDVVAKGRGGDVARLAALLATHDGRCLIDVVAAFDDAAQGVLPFGPTSSAEGLEMASVLRPGTLDGFAGRIDLVVAHDAGAVRKRFIDDHRSLRGLPWVCSRRTISWRDYGVDGDGMGSILASLRRFSPMDEPADACRALAAILSEENWTTSQPPPLATLLKEAGGQGVELVANGPTFALRDQLKSRGWRWSATARSWSIRVPRNVAPVESAWVLERLHPIGGSVRTRELADAVRI